MSAFWGYLAKYASHVQKICLDETHKGFVEQCFKPTESFTQQSGMFTQQETCMCIAVIWSCVYIYIYINIKRIQSNYFDCCLCHYTHGTQF